MKEGDFKEEGLEELSSKETERQLAEMCQHWHSTEILKLSKELVDLSSFHSAAESSQW